MGGECLLSGWKGISNAKVFELSLEAAFDDTIVEELMAELLRFIYCGHALSS